jgi:polyisoprenyl-phosphate glycosyltransferase
MIELTVVIPAFNEEQNVATVWQSVRDALATERDLEILFVDDGSTDATAARIRELGVRDPAVRLIRFTRNFGHQAALLAGLEAARGAAVLTLDCDLQHPPELLPRMVEAWRKGAPVVQMVRTGTAGASWLKRLTSAAFYRLLNVLSETPVQRGAADYQLLDRSVVDAVLQFRDRCPFLRGIVAWLGFPAARIEYVAPRRVAGRSGYTVRKMLRLSVQAITGLSAKPLRFAFYLGLATAVLCLAYAGFALVAMATGRTVQGWTSVIVTVTFLGAIQLVSLGIVGEYIARIYEQTRGVPRYIIAEGAPERQRSGAGREMV